MALTSSNNVADALDAADRRKLLDAAQAAIAAGLRGLRPAALCLDAYNPALCVPAATFVTLELGGALRGCVGTLEAFQPLIIDATENAYSAAFRDPRFPAITEPEFAEVEMHVSVLSIPEPITFASEQELMEQLRPGIDGLILSEQGRRGTFLPAVWDAVADAHEFLGHLKAKAGLPRNYWSDTIKAWRYTTTSIP